MGLFNFTPYGLENYNFGLYVGKLKSKAKKQKMGNCNSTNNVELCEKKNISNKSDIKTFRKIL